MNVVAATAVPVETLRPLTYADLDQYPDDGQRREIITGELNVTAAPTPAHQIILGRLFKMIMDHADRHDAGTAVVSPVDVRLTLHDIVEPDIVFVSRANEELLEGKFIDGPPDLVVEVLSPSTQRTDLVRKRALYARSGIAEYWIVDPDRKSIQIHRLEAGIYQPEVDADGESTSRVLAGLVIDAEKLFENIRRTQEK